MADMKLHLNKKQCKIFPQANRSYLICVTFSMFKIKYVCSKCTVIYMTSINCIFDAKYIPLLK